MSEHGNTHSQEHPTTVAPDRSGRLLPPASDEENIRLIGALLCKAISRLPVTLETGRTPIVPATPEDRILELLARHHTASPGEMRALLGLSRSRIHLALKRLRQTGQIVPTGGRTTAAAYRRVDLTRN